MLDTISNTVNFDFGNLCLPIHFFFNQHLIYFTFLRGPYFWNKKSNAAFFVIAITSDHKRIANMQI